MEAMLERNLDNVSAMRKAMADQCFRRTISGESDTLCPEELAQARNEVVWRPSPKLGCVVMVVVMLGRTQEVDR